MALFLIVSTLVSAIATFVIVFTGLSSPGQQTETQSRAAPNQEITNVKPTTILTPITPTPTPPTAGQAPASSPTPSPITIKVIISPYITATTSADKKIVSLVFNNTSDSRSALYKFTYSSNSGDKSTSGNITFDSSSQKVSREIVLGVCSGDACTYDTGVKNIKIIVTFTQKDGTKSEITFPYQL